MAKRDCFAYTNKDKHEGCMALNDLYCKKEECRFYKNKQDVDRVQIERDIREYANKKIGGTHDKRPIDIIIKKL